MKIGKDIAKISKELSAANGADVMTRYRAYQNANAALFHIKWTILLHKHYK